MFRLMGKGKRINRATYWTIIAIVFGLSLFLHRIGIVFSIVALVASAKRCRDFGWPGWVPPAVTGALVGLLLSVVAQYASTIHQHPADLVSAAPGLSAKVGILMLLNLVFTVVIGCIPGTGRTNRFGPPPRPGVGKGVEDEWRLAEVFGDGPAPDPYQNPQGYIARQAHAKAAQPQPVRRAAPSTPRSPEFADGTATAAYTVIPATAAHTIRGGFGRKGL